MNAPRPPTDGHREPGREPDRDAFLRAALRHAPDRDTRPPDALNERILRRAREAAAPVRPAAPSWWARAAEALGRLAQPAPTAALASLMLATVIGVMWRDGPPPDETVRGTPSTPAEERAAAPVQARPDAAAAQSRPDTPARAAEAPANTSARAEPAATPPMREAGRLDAERERAAPPRAPVTPAARKEAPVDTPKAAIAPASPAAQADAVAPTAPQAAAAEEARVRAPQGPRANAGARAPTAPSANAGAQVPTTPRANAEAHAPQAEAAAPPPTLPPPAPAGAAPRAAAEDTATREASPDRRQAVSRAVLAPASGAETASFANLDPLAEPARAWAGASDDQRAALAALRRAAAGRWQPARSAPPGDADALLLRDGQGTMLGRLLMVADTVWWLPQAPTGVGWHAALVGEDGKSLARRLGLPPHAEPAVAPGR